MDHETEGQRIAAFRVLELEVHDDILGLKL